MDNEAKSAFTHVYEQLRDGVACAVIFPDRNAAPERAMAGVKATLSLISTPQRQFVLTCQHVWQAFLAEKHKTSSAELVMVGTTSRGSALLSDAVVIDEDPRLDMITLDATRLDERVTLCNKRFHHIQKWPLETPEPRDTLVAVGYPGEHQQPYAPAPAQQNAPSASLHPAALIVTVTSVSMRHIVCAEDSDDNPRMAEIIAAGLVLPKSLGGISGAAYFTNDPSSMRLAGIQYEATKNGGYQSAILVARTSYLREDGTIDHAALP